MRKKIVILIFLSVLISCSATKNNTRKYICKQNSEETERSINLVYQNNELKQYTQTFQRSYSSLDVDKQIFIQEMEEDIAKNENQVGQSIEFIPQEEDYIISITYDFEKSKNYKPFETRHYSFLITIETLKVEKEFISALKKSGYNCNSNDQSER